MKKNTSFILVVLITVFSFLSTSSSANNILSRMDQTISKVDGIIANQSVTKSQEKASVVTAQATSTHTMPQDHSLVLPMDKKNPCQDGRLCDAFDEDVKNQTTEGLRKVLRIEDAFLEAKKSEEMRSLNGHAVAEDTQPQPVIETAENVIRAVLKPEALGQKIDLDFDEIKLSDILGTIGKTAGVNILLDPALRGQQLDLHLKQVTLEEALILIANAYNLGFKQVADSLYVTSREKLKQENVSSRVFRLKNISAEVAKVLLEDITKEISVSEEINSIMVVGQPEDIINAENVLKRIDLPQPQVILEAQIIEMARDALHELGIDWQDTINIQYQEDERDTDLDDITKTNDKGLFEISTFSRTPLQFENIIRMLENQNKAKILSSPRITTLNNKEAEIFVGDEVPYTVTTISGGATTTEVRFVEPGIRLKITPSIIDRDFVVIRVEPEVSFIFTFRGPNDEYPQVRTREATANVRVKNKQLFVLGGILTQEDKQNLFKVPFLGDIPLVGNLFSYTTQTALDTELIITVLPTVVYGDF